MFSNSNSFIQTSSELIKN